MSQRTVRVDELLRQEIGRILAKDVQDPQIGFATVTGVGVATIAALIGAAFFPSDNETLEILLVWAGFAVGFVEAEASWILEDNTMMRRVLEVFGATPYKTYRLYEQSIV